MVNKKLLEMFFLFIACCIPVVFVGGILLLFLSLSGKVTFYLPFTIALLIVICFFICNAIFKFLKPNITKKLAVILFSIFAMAFIVHFTIDAYHNSLDSLEDAEVDLFEYQPFYSSKLATLEEATLTLKDDLPVLDGATALYPVYAAFVQATYPEKEYDVYNSEVMGNTTPEAYNNLIEGKVDIIFAAGPSESQLNDAKRKGVELELTPIGREAFVFFVNKDNPIDGLTTEQIQKIYSGEITNWKEVGGKNDKIKAFQRPADSGSQTALEKFMGDIPIMEAPTEDVVAGMGGIIEQTANYRNYKNAIGYSFRFFSMDMVENDSIKHLQIDGVYPTKETIRTNEYPLASEFYAITAGSDNPNAEKFIEWILSEQGQYLIEKSGYVPIH